MERKSLSAPVRFKEFNDDSGVATFVASVFGNVDHSKDRVFKGAFTKSIQSARQSGRMPKFVADHDWSVTKRLGKVLDLYETDEGLEVQVRFNLDKQVAREAYSDFKFAPEDQEFSFGYSVKSYKPNEHGGRDLLEMDLFEVSSVLIGDNQKTRLVDVKAAEDEGADESDKDDAADAGETTNQDNGPTISAALAATRERVNGMLDEIENLLKA